MNTFCSLSRNACHSAALHTDCDKERLIAFFTKFLDSSILTHFYSAFELYAHLPDNINLSINYVLFKTIARNTIHEHSARSLLFFKNSNGITV